MNAISRSMIKEMHEALDEAEEDNEDQSGNGKFAAAEVTPGFTPVAGGRRARLD